nr:tripartite tricarboxylate transporter permease [Pseudophaeobacter leonis]
MDTFLAILTVFTQPELLFLVGLGTFVGIYIGAIPGLSVTMAVSILISFTFSWEVYPAISLMVGIYMGGVYGGSRTAILLNIPGAPSAIATALDGYPMAQRGEAGQAIGVTTVMSFFGGLVGILVLALAAPFVSEFAIKFQPAIYAAGGSRDFTGRLIVQRIDDQRDICRRLWHRHRGCRARPAHLYRAVHL